MIMNWTLKDQQPRGESTNTSYLIILITFSVLLAKAACGISGREAVS
jgi:hypothetical protein